jgi:hypothetical protein
MKRQADEHSFASSHLAQLRQRAEDQQHTASSVRSIMRQSSGQAPDQQIASPLINNAPRSLNVSRSDQHGSSMRSTGASVPAPSVGTTYGFRVPLSSQSLRASYQNRDCS